VQQAFSFFVHLVSLTSSTTLGSRMNMLV
jgi:hypothetical protein